MYVCTDFQRVVRLSFPQTLNNLLCSKGGIVGDSYNLGVCEVEVAVGAIGW